MLEINYSVPVRPQFLNTCLFRASAQILFSSRHYSLCTQRSAALFKFRSIQVLLFSATGRGICELKKLVCIESRRLLKSFLIDQEQIINL